MLLHKKLYLQPYISLFALNHDFFSFRDAFLKEEVAYWCSHPFPDLLAKECFFAVFRNKQNQTVWEEITEAEHLLLKQMRKGDKLSKALELLEEGGEKLLEDALVLLPLWFQKWTSMGWFTRVKAF